MKFPFKSQCRKLLINFRVDISCLKRGSNKIPHYTSTSFPLEKCNCDIIIKLRNIFERD